MRRITFRGKRIHMNMWSYGSLYIREVDGFEKYFIIENDKKPWRRVIPETVGQFIGLKDKNGVDIYEDDIVRILDTDWISKSENDKRTLEQYLTDIADVGVIIYDKCKFSVAIYSDNYEIQNICPINVGKYGYIEVIGNIHDDKIIDRIIKK